MDYTLPRENVGEQKDGAADQSLQIEMEVSHRSNTLDAKKQYYQDKVAGLSYYPKRLMSLTRYLLDDLNELILLNFDSNVVLANKFCYFFHGEIDIIRYYLSNNQDSSTTYSTYVSFNGHTHSVLAPVRENEIRYEGIRAILRSWSINRLVLSRSAHTLYCLESYLQCV